MKHFCSAYRRLLRCWLLLPLGVCGPLVTASAQSFASPVTYSTGASSGPELVAVGDINGDGRPDIITGNYGGQDIGVLLSQANGFASAVHYPLGPTTSVYYQLTGLKLVDVNADGRLDIVVAFGKVGVFLGQAGGTFSAITTYAASPVQDSTPEVALGDVNGDGRLDIVAANPGDSNVGILLGQSTGFSAATTYSLGNGNRPSGVALADLNSDGRLDIVTANGTHSVTGMGRISVLLAGATGGFAAPVFYNIGASTSPNKVVVGDLDNDGIPDVVTVNFSYNNVSVLRGQTAGTLAAPVTYNTGGPFSSNGNLSNSIGDAKLSDVNGDNLLDIIATMRLANGAGVGILVGQPNGFQPAVTFSTDGTAYTGGVPTGLEVKDVDRDGRVDIIATLSVPSQISILRNTGTFLAAASAQDVTAQLQVYPNPTHAGFTVQALPAGGQVDLYNMAGQVVRRLTGASGAAGSRWVDVSGLPAGLYTLRSQVGDRILVSRVVIE